MSAIVSATATTGITVTVRGTGGPTPGIVIMLTAAGAGNETSLIARLRSGEHYLMKRATTMKTGTLTQVDRNCRSAALRRQWEHGRQ
jgi:hypothetical protein